ncbi:MAG: FAD-binding oxidoreductase [Deltaproteobacteria bacterium]|jgi:glycolate oxidase|nr:FAD-binding oxidoreductase [Deltaproteobacteria bacterium]
MTITPSSLSEATEAIKAQVAAAKQVLPVGRNSSNLSPSSDKVEIVSTQKLVAIHSLEPDNLLAVVEAGLTAGEVQKNLAPTGLYWPVTGLCDHTIGAIMNEGLLGVETMARGTMCDWVLGATMIDASGRLISSGGRTLKNVSGYDLTRLAWRSRGSLAMSAAFILKLLPKPKAFGVYCWSIDSPSKASDLAQKVILSKIRPEALRIVGEPKDIKIIAWLCGFPEMVSHQKEKLSEILGDISEEQQDGFKYFDEHSTKWSYRDKTLSLHQGRRRELIEFVSRLEKIQPDYWRFDIDLGGGRALLGEGLKPTESSLLPVVPISDPGNIVRRLKASIDPSNVFWPLSPEQKRA